MQDVPAAPAAIAPADDPVLAFADPRALAAATLGGADAILLDPESDGLSQIVDMLVVLQVKNVGEVHLACVCEGGLARLCGTVLAADGCGKGGADWAMVGRRLAPAGRLLLHGLEALNGRARENLVETLAPRLNRCVQVARAAEPG